MTNSEEAWLSIIHPIDGPGADSRIVLAANSSAVLTVNNTGMHTFFELWCAFRKPSLSFCLALFSHLNAINLTITNII